MGLGASKILLCAPTAAQNVPVLGKLLMVIIVETSNPKVVTAALKPCREPVKATLAFTVPPEVTVILQNQILDQEILANQHPPQLLSHQEYQPQLQPLNHPMMVTAQVARGGNKTIIMEHGALTNQPATTVVCAMFTGHLLLDLAIQMDIVAGVKDSPIKVDVMAVQVPHHLPQHQQLPRHPLPHLPLSQKHVRFTLIMLAQPILLKQNQYQLPSQAILHLEEN